ncbi:L-arabinose transport system permease protein AraQ [Clavibacter michiganensis subsp. michiganensis]|uniref:L-arabinose transport system permease protein AraQ n=1 Tax=Clavibacter michiganensis subsp. michiganensis TaxID=33013 RepID=A0A251XIS6_CLAMM|nr:L-arabinose transport system permease protein AraQ [Clavibacter michiganensis subsp. michiganensis]OUE03331.1 L-arabinose transport system permease protein AraQ [Clavibacter michiganensis subsp. michiganensis]
MSVDTRQASGERAGTRPVRAQRSGVSKGQLKKSQTIAPWVLLAPFLAVFLLTFVLPIIYAVFQSFTTVRREGLFGEQGVTTVFAGFENYALALANDAFTASIGRVLLFGIVQVPVMIILCTILALLLESASAKWPQFFRAAYFMPYGVPGVIATILWGFLYIPGLSPIIDIAQMFGIQLDFLGAGTVLWSIANIVTWTYTGYNMLIIIAQLKSIPGDVYEAARIDGRARGARRCRSSCRSSGRRSCSRPCSRSSGRCSCSRSRRCSPPPPPRSTRSTRPTCRRTRPRSRTTTTASRRPRRSSSPSPRSCCRSSSSRSPTGSPRRSGKPPQRGRRGRAHDRHGGTTDHHRDGRGEGGAEAPRAGRRIEGEPSVEERQRPGRGHQAATRIIVTAILTLVALYFLVPVYYIVVAATKTTADLFSTNGFLFANMNLWQNLTMVFTYDDGIFVRWFLNSVLYAGVGALVATYFAAAGGYALAKYKFRGSNLVFGTILGGVLVPGTATALPLFLLFSSMGIANTYWSVLIPSLVSPFGLFLCRIYAQASVEDAVIESGRIDGASELRIFHTLALRSMTPALVTVFLFQLVGIWNNYFLPLIMLADTKLYPITLGLNNWRSQVDRLPEFYQLTTGGVLVSIIPLIAAMIVLQRFWRGGLTDGA